jgi:hypothetical protein
MYRHRLAALGLVADKDEATFEKKLKKIATAKPKNEKSSDNGGSSRN